MGCQKAQGFLESHVLTVGERTDASKDRKGRNEALALARRADRVIVARGKKIVTFDMKKAPPDDDTLAAHLLGPTGNLRAPTLRLGKTLLVGFSPTSAVRTFFRPFSIYRSS
jgi:hypothetical protein